ERSRIDGDGADSLVAVDHHAGATLVRKPRDAGDVQPGTVAKAHLRDGDELRPLVDRAREILQRDVTVGRPGYVHHLRVAALLCVPDLRVGRKLEVADDDLVAWPREIERAGERVDTRRGGCRHRDLIRR